MLRFEPLEELPRRLNLSLSCVFQPLPDSLSGVRTGGDIKQALIGFRVLHDSRRLALHSEHHGSLALLELFYEIARSPAKSSEGMNVLRDVEHEALHFAPF